MAKANLLQFDGDSTKLTERGKTMVKETLGIVERLGRMEDDDDAKAAATHLAKVVETYCGANGESATD